MAADDVYLTAIQSLIERFTELAGEKPVMMRARRAPLDIDKDNTVTGYYGDGKEALDILLTQFEELFGQDMADRKARNVLTATIGEDHMAAFPDRLQT